MVRKKIHTEIVESFLIFSFEITHTNLIKISEKITIKYFLIEDSVKNQ